MIILQRTLTVTQNNFMKNMEEAIVLVISNPLDVQ